MNSPGVPGADEHEQGLPLLLDLELELELDELLTEELELGLLLGLLGGGELLGRLELPLVEQQQNGINLVIMVDLLMADLLMHL